VRFEFLAQPVRIVARRKGDWRRMRADEFGTERRFGRPAPRPVDGSHFVIAADRWLKAIGQEKASLAARLNFETLKGYIESMIIFRRVCPASMQEATVSALGEPHPR